MLWILAERAGGHACLQRVVGRSTAQRYVTGPTGKPRSDGSESLHKPNVQHLRLPKLDAGQQQSSR